MSDQLLTVRDLRKTFRVPGGGKNRLCALDGINLDLARGETLGLVGESGCGKSTLARTLMMLERPDSGTVTFDGVDPFGLRGKDLLKFRRRVQMVFQDPYASLNSRMSAGDLIAEPWRTHKALHPSRKDRDMRRARRQGRGQVPAGILRRAAPAHRHRQGARARPRRDHLRRTGLRARPVGAGTGAQPAQRSTGSARHLVCVHQP
jgi:ABC-type glutathione transport system ATPase component